MKYTKLLSEWVAGLRYEDIPAPVIEKAKEQLYSIIGAALMGANNSAVRGVVNAVAAYDQSDVAAVFGTSRRVSPGSAAMANAFAAQIFEFEDWAIYSHSGASVVSTAMAIGEAQGVSGKELLTAIVLGNELAGRTGLAIARGAYVGNSLPNHQVDASFVAGRLLGLNADQLASAIGLGCFLAMETCPIGYMTDAKGLINSFPAYAGIMAALMAREGVVGNRDMIEHPAGYLATVSEFVDLNELTDGLGVRWVLPTLHTKPYPICGYNIAPIHAALEIVGKHGVLPEQIEHIDVYAAGVTLYAGKRYHAMEPDIYTQIENGDCTHVPLLFDVPYPMAAAIFDRELTPRQYDREHILDPEIQALARRITLKVDPEMHAAYYRFEYASRVEMLLKDGRKLEATVPQMPGAPGCPFDVPSKFLKGAEMVLDEVKARRAVSLIASLEEQDNVRTLGLALQP